MLQTCFLFFTNNVHDLLLQKMISLYKHIGINGSTRQILDLQKIATSLFKHNGINGSSRQISDHTKFRNIHVYTNVYNVQMRTFNKMKYLWKKKNTLGNESYTKTNRKAMDEVPNKKN